MAIAVEDLPTSVGDTSGLDAALNEVAGHLNAQHARLVDLTVTLLADEHLWREEGLHTLELFLAWRLGLSTQRARQVVAIARRARDLPECIETFRRGELAIDQMAAIALRAPWWTDSEISELATMLTVNQLRNMLAKYPFPDIADPNAEPTEPSPEPADGSDDPDGESPDDGESPEPADAGDRNDSNDAGDGADGSPDPLPNPNDPKPAEPRMWWGIGDDGVFRLHAECDPIVGMMLDAALREAHDALIRGGQTDVTDIDALHEIARRSLAAIETPERQERFRTYVHLRTDGTCTDAHGWTLPDAIRRYITCDGLLSPVFIEGDIPISVGRTQRTIPLRTRRLVLLRDQGCRVPGCNQTHHIEIHHIVHWEHDGPTETWNLIALCPQHHRRHHRGELGISGNADTPGGITFTNRHGKTIGSTGARPEPPGAPPPPPTSEYQHPLGERLDPRWLYFNPPPEHRQTAWANHPYNPHRSN